MAHGRVFVGLHGAREIRDRLHTAKSEDDTHKRDPDVSVTAMEWLQVCECEVRNTECDDGDNHAHGRQSQCDSEAAAVAGAKIIDGTNE